MRWAEARRSAFRFIKRRGRPWGTAFVRRVFTVVAFLAWVAGGTYRRGRGGRGDSFHCFSGGGGSGSGQHDPREGIKKILLVRMDLLGDVILTVPAVAAVRRRYPQARITMLVLPYTAPALELFPYVDTVMTYDINLLRPSGDMLNLFHYRDLWRMLRRLRRERYDLAISFYGLYAGILSFLSGARWRVGYRGEGCAFLFNLPVPGCRYRLPQHEVEYNLTLARAGGADQGAGDVQADIPEAARERVEALLKRQGIRPEDPLVVIHPGSTNGSAKRWTPSGWACLADHLAGDLGARVIFNGVASETPLIEDIVARMGTRPTVLAGKTSILELASLLTRCRVLVTGDSAPLHLAGALDVPVVALFGPTDPAVSGPRGRQAVVLRKDIPCSPCYDLLDTAECSRGHVACMEAIPEEEVFAAVKNMLRESSPAAPRTLA